MIWFIIAYVIIGIITSIVVSVVFGLEDDIMIGPVPAFLIVVSWPIIWVARAFYALGFGIITISELIRCCL